jgi:hypothetical protein
MLSNYFFSFSFPLESLGPRGHEWCAKRRVLLWLAKENKLEPSEIHSILPYVLLSSWTVLTCCYLEKKRCYSCLYRSLVICMLRTVGFFAVYHFKAARVFKYDVFSTAKPIIRRGARRSWTRRQRRRLPDRSSQKKRGWSIFVFRAFALCYNDGSLLPFRKTSSQWTICRHLWPTSRKVKRKGEENKSDWDLREMPGSPSPHNSTRRFLLLDLFCLFRVH